MRLENVLLSLIVAFGISLSAQLDAQQADEKKEESVSKTQGQTDDELTREQEVPVAKTETKKDPKFRPSEEISEDTPVPFPIDI